MDPEDADFLAWKQGHVVKSWKKRMFIVRKGVLRYAKDSGGGGWKGEVNLAGATQAEVQEEKGKWSWSIQTRAPGSAEGGAPVLKKKVSRRSITGGHTAATAHEEYTLACESEEEAARCKQQIAAHIAFATEAQLVGGGGSGAEAPPPGLAASQSMSSDALPTAVQHSVEEHVQEQQRLEMALEGLLLKIEGGGDAKQLMCGEDFQGALARLKTLQQRQRELLSSDGAESITRRFPQLLPQSKTLLELLSQITEGGAKDEGIVQQGDYE
jgi:hypothetical protein